MTQTIITSSEKLQKKHKTEHEPYEYYKQSVTEKDFPLATVAFYDIPPHKSNYPMHYHENNTEVFYIIKGCGDVRTPQGTFAIKEGDVIVCPPGEGGAHKITNSSYEVLRLLDIDTNNRPDTVHYPDSDKTGYFDKAGNAGVFMKNGREVSYYTGE